jgi:hypothetical protein
MKNIKTNGGKSKMAEYYNTRYGRIAKEPNHTASTRAFTFVDDELSKALEQYCRTFRMKKSAVIRTALVRFLKAEGYEPEDN